uniref:DUF3240 family protein n=1 Tax=Granulicella mallensis TaxID=940614 RepID=UPI001CBDC5A7
MRHIRNFIAAEVSGYTVQRVSNFGGDLRRAYVIKDRIPGTNDRVLIQVVRNAQAWGEVLLRCRKIVLRHALRDTGQF